MVDGKPRGWLSVALLLVVVLLCAGCGRSSIPLPPTAALSTPPVSSLPTPPPGEADVQIGMAVVDSVEVYIMESYPVQVSAVVRGNLPDGCTRISHSKQVLEGDTIRIELFTERPTDMMCTEALVPYEETVHLDITGLPDGPYTLDVNGVQVEFNLEGGGG